MQRRSNMGKSIRFIVMLGVLAAAMGAPAAASTPKMTMNRMDFPMLDLLCTWTVFLSIISDPSIHLLRKKLSHMLFADLPFHLFTFDSRMKFLAGDLLSRDSGGGVSIRTMSYSTDPAARCVE